MAALQISTLRTAMENYKKDISDVGVSLFVQWSDFVNKALYRFMVGTEPERFITTYDISIVSGTSTYALPANFRSIDTIGTGLYYVNDDLSNTDRFLARTSFGSSAPGYYISQGNIVITPSPNSATTYRLRYIPNVASLSSYSNYFTDDGTLTGNILVPDEFLENMVKIMDIRYTEWNEDPAEESNAGQRYMNAMDELVRCIKKESNNTFMPDMSVIYSNTYTLY